MIVQPDFLRHWKVRKTVAMTGEPSAPLVLIRLWAHCQASRKWEFPELKKDDLIAICEWNFPKISLEKVLITCRWIEKIKGGGYRVRGWEEHNKNLITNWKRNPSGKARDDSDSDPTGTPRAPHDEPDKTKPNQTRLNEIKPDQTKPNQTPAPAVATSHSEASQPSGGTVIENVFKGRLDGRAEGLEGFASKNRALTFTIPDERTVFNYLDCSFIGAGQYAKPFLKAMRKSGWKGKDGRQVQDWRALAKEYAAAAARNQLGVP